MSHWPSSASRLAMAGGTPEEVRWPEGSSGRRASVRSLVRQARVHASPAAKPSVSARRTILSIEVLSRSVVCRLSALGLPETSLECKVGLSLTRHQQHTVPSLQVMGQERFLSRSTAGEALFLVEGY